MYGGGDSNASINTKTITGTKDTLHISPHIAAHKSVLAISSQDLHLSNDHQDASNSVDSRLIHSTMCHLPTYKIGIPTSAIYKGGADIHSSDDQHEHIRSSYVQEIAKIQPQDLSAHSHKFAIATSIADTSVVKNLSHIHTVESISGQVIITERERFPQTSYRLSDGTTICISGQHSAIPVLLSSVNDETQNSSQSENSHSMQTPTSISTAISAGGSFQGTLQSHSHMTMSSIHEGHFIIPEVIATNYINNSESILPDRDSGTHISMMRTNLEEVKEEKLDDQKDLVRQALQEAVQNHHRLSPSNQVIDYNYGEDIGELLMMNINVNPGCQTTNRLSETVVVSAHANNIGSAGQVVVLHPAATYSEDGCVMTSAGPLMLSSRSRRRSKLSDEAQAIRKVKIANRMREKRANESDDQKERRRLREAERMRRKRAQEDEESKEKRRKEAAERARLRRLKLSPEEREVERKKAAVRMRLRRQNENDEQKRLRRIKAAERMRRRRATETPEQKANRKQGIAMRMKVRRKKRPEGGIKAEKDPLAITFDCLERRLHQDYEKDSNATNSESPNIHIVQNQHIVVSSAMPGLEEMEEEISPTTRPSVSSAPGELTSLELVHHPQSVSLQVRNMSPLQDQEIHDKDKRDCPPVYHKAILLHHDSSLSQGIQVQSRSTDNSSPIPQTISVQKGGTHHLPHILHNLSPQPDSHHHHSSLPSHTTYIVPHTTAPTHYSIQLRHQ